MNNNFIQLCVSFLWCFLFLQSGILNAQSELQEEDLQEILKALQESDMPAEYSAPLSDQIVNTAGPFMQGWWDGRVSFSSEGQVDQLSKLKIQAGRLMLRGRVRRSSDGETMTAGSTFVDLGPLEIQAGGIGMNAGYGLLIERPGRSAGLSAGQSFRSLSNRNVGWATLPEKKSLWGIGARLKGRVWNVALMHGKSGDEKSNTPLSLFHLVRTLGPLSLGMGGVYSPSQNGATFSGIWQSGFTHLGFELASWANKNEEGHPGAWLVSFQAKLPLDVTLQGRWAASNSNEGSNSGGRPGVLNTWGGSGWAVRLRGRASKIWLLQALISQGKGPDWDGSHGRQKKNLVDLLLLGKFSSGWEIKCRWNERIRISESWSEQYPWLPPEISREDERVSLALDIKKKQHQGAWIVSVRSLGRDGVTNSGRRTLAGIRYKGSMSAVVSFLLSHHWSWGAPVDLVSAVNPIRGLVLPRHWGHWDSESMAGIDLNTRLGKLMAAISRREPISGSLEKAENRVWVGFQAKWE